MNSIHVNTNDSSKSFTQRTTARGKLVVNLVGGLGNQLFQYAFARSLSLKTGLPLFLDVSEFRRYKLRKFLLDRFEIYTPHYPELRSLAMKRLRHRRIGKSLFRILNTEIITERSPLFQEVHVNPQKASLLEGYWQSEKYFCDHRDIILKDFSIRAQPSQISADLLQKINAGSSVALHVRRGDYVSDPAAQAHHGTCSLDYYRQAVELMRNRIQSPHFYVFSDDPEWTQANLKINSPTTYVTHNSPETPEEDLRLMSACAHFIIANSSLSWWGAWLSKSTNPIVVTPKRWFRTESVDTSDLIPPKWVRI